MKRRILTGALCALLVISLGINLLTFFNSGRGAKNYAAMDEVNFYAVPQESKEAYAADSGMMQESYETKNLSAEESGEMLIKHADITFTVEKNQEVYENIRQKIYSLRGRIDASDAYLRSQKEKTYTIQARIPSAQYEDFIAYLKEFGTTESFSESSTNIAQQYHDNELRISLYENKLERLYTLMEEAKDISDLLTLESYVSDTIYQIESLKSIQKDYEDEVSYSTVYITIQPLLHQEIETRSFTSVVRDAFADSANMLLNVGEFLLRAVIFAAPYVLVLSGGYLIYRKVKKH